VTVNYAGYWMISLVYLNPAAKGYNLFNGLISANMLVLEVLILIPAVRTWSRRRQEQKSGVIPGWLASQPRCCDSIDKLRIGQDKRHPLGCRLSCQENADKNAARCGYILGN